MKIYFVTASNATEKEVIREVKPDNLLCSYYYFKNIDMKDFIEEIGYKPNILLDSGAFSAWTKGKNIALLDYMNYVDRNKDYIENYISLDVVGDPDVSYKYYEIMLMKGFSPIPVYHYGSDERHLYKYTEDHNCKYIALGGTVPISSKKEVSKWASELKEVVPTVNFHLLGSSSPHILENEDIYSCDSSTWILQAYNGRPKELPDKVERAKYNMRAMIGDVS